MIQHYKQPAAKEFYHLQQAVLRIQLLTICSGAGFDKPLAASERHGVVLKKVRTFSTVE